MRFQEATEAQDILLARWPRASVRLFRSSRFPQFVVRINHGDGIECEVRSLKRAQELVQTADEAERDQVQLALFGGRRRA